MQFNENFIYQESQGSFRVEVICKYIQERSRPSDQNYFYAYHVKVFNEGISPCKILGRHWIIRDGQKSTKHVHGEGVVGLTPLIKPESYFEYTSFCPLSTPTGSMRGKFKLINLDTQELFWISIPLFFLRADFH